MSDQSDKNKVIVTGMGAISCLGNGVEQLWSGVLEGESSFSRIDRFDLEGSSYVYGGMVDLDGGGPDDNSSLGAQFAVDAAQQALEGVPRDMRDDLAVVLSSNFGPSEVQENALTGDSTSTGLRRKLRDGFFTFDLDHVARAIGAGGERTNISLSCASGNAALSHALNLVRSGEAKMVLAGGYDSIQKISWAGLACLRVMAVSENDEPPVVRPFDKNRSGTLFSEGAGMMLLETEGHARERGAEPMAELVGAGVNNNAHHMTHADEEGRATAEVMRMALHDGGISPDEVDCLNAHGTGTALNDAIETRAAREVFGEKVNSLPVTSIKGTLGHGMGAASILEAITCVRSIQNDRIPPTSNYATPDAECGLNIVTDASHDKPVEVVLNNSAGIGGANAAVVFRQLS